MKYSAMGWWLFAIWVGIDIFLYFMKYDCLKVCLWN